VLLKIKNAPKKRLFSHFSGTPDSHDQRVTTHLQEHIAAFSSASSRLFENPDFDNGVAPRCAHQGLTQQTAPRPSSPTLTDRFPPLTTL
jgi:hypothetical protein